ncbi:MAG: flagellar hook-associated protein FlgK, partial [Gammaproteobacteria bacterium]
MSDLIGIGVSGLSAYQRALATTSNNIANLQTEGYVRQRAVLASSAQDGSSTISIGTGVRFAEVQRLYDRFAEENLQRATSGLEAEQGMLKELQALQNAIGSSEAGLHGAFQDFFDSARELEASPASAGSRAGFLAKAEGLAARFRALASTASNLDDGTRAQIDQAVGETNTLLEQIASLNAQLLKRTSASEQPMQLLDQRDISIREITKKLGVTVVIGQSGAANIYAGDSASGAALVENGRARVMSASFDPYDYGKSEFVLDAKSQPVVLPGIRSGLIGGLIRFRREGLGTASNKLDELALAFGRAVNKIHRQGIDSSGRPGEDLFYVGPRFVVDGAANGGSARLGVTVLDPEMVKSTSYEMKFSSALGKWEVRNKSTGATTTGADSIKFEGLQFSVQGSARDGDTFRVTPENHPAATLATLIKDGSQVASAGKLAVRAGVSNTGATAAEMTLVDAREKTAVRSLAELLPSPKSPIGEQSFTPDSETGVIDPYQDTAVAARTGPIAFIPAGYSKIALATAIGEGSELAVFTRDGRQISGPKMAGTIVDEKYGFYAGATYSDAYLNKLDDPDTDATESYLGLSFGRGVTAESGRQTDVDGQVILTPARLFGASGVSNSASPYTLLVNGHEIAIGSNRSVAQVVSAINAQKATTGVVARVDTRSTTATTDDSLILSAYHDVRFPVSKIDVVNSDRASVIVNGAEYSAGWRVRIADGDLATGTNFIELNGKRYSFTSLSDLEITLDDETVSNSGLSAAIGSTATTITVLDAASYPSSGTVIIGSEEITYTAVSGNSLTGCVRGVNSTVAASHAINSPVKAKVFDATYSPGTLTVKVKDTGLQLQNKGFLKIGANSVGLTEREEFFFQSATSSGVASKLVSLMNAPQSGIVASNPGSNFVITNTDSLAGNPISIGLNTVGLETKTYFNAADI